MADRVLIATSPFGECGIKPLRILEQAGFEILHNPFGRRLKAGEVKDLVADVDAVIAGTEPYDAETLAGGRRLKLISRVGERREDVSLM